SYLYPFLVTCFFFFSSRRRHTRFSRDWSSDVCSSDLTRLAICSTTAVTVRCTPSRRLRARRSGAAFRWSPLACRKPSITTSKARSEERRVGKECRSRRSTQHEKIKDNNKVDERAKHTT